MVARKTGRRSFVRSPAPSGEGGGEALRDHRVDRDPPSRWRSRHRPSEPVLLKRGSRARLPCRRRVYEYCVGSVRASHTLAARGARPFRLSPASRRGPSGARPARAIPVTCDGHAGSAAPGRAVMDPAQPSPGAREEYARAREGGDKSGGPAIHHPAAGPWWITIHPTPRCALLPAAPRLDRGAQGAAFDLPCCGAASGRVRTSGKGLRGTARDDAALAPWTPRSGRGAAERGRTSSQRFGTGQGGGPWTAIAGCRGRGSWCRMRPDG